MPLQITEPIEGIHRFDDIYTNSYLLVEGGRLTMIDGGLPGDWRAFTSYVSNLGHKLEEHRSISRDPSSPALARAEVGIRSYWTLDLRSDSVASYRRLN